MHLLLLATLLSFLTAVDAFAQQAPPKVQVSGRPPTFDEMLREHHVELTEAGLLRALKSSDADVRYLSAMKLAEDKVLAAVPAIRETLAAETVPRDRANIALALGLLEDPSGRAELKKMCADENFPPEFRLYAVRYMFDLGVEDDGGCLKAAEEIVKLLDSENRRVGDRITALELLVRFRNLTSQDTQAVFHLVLGRLNDPEATVRMQASSSLASLGDPNAIPYLENAVTEEKDEVIRSVLKANLEELQQKQKE